MKSENAKVKGWMGSILFSSQKKLKNRKHRRFYRQKMEHQMNVNHLFYDPLYIDRV